MPGGKRVLLLEAPPLASWLGFLDQDAHLPWWNGQKRAVWMSVARERWERDGVLGTRLAAAIGEAMRRVAARWPYVRWGTGPMGVVTERQVLGLWPDKAALWHGIRQGRVLPMPAQAWQEGREAPGHEEQRWWLVHGERWCALHKVTGMQVWLCDGEGWTVAAWTRALGARVPEGEAQGQDVTA